MMYIARINGNQVFFAAIIYPASGFLPVQLLEIKIQVLSAISYLRSDLNHNEAHDQYNKNSSHGLDFLCK